MTGRILPRSNSEPSPSTPLFLMPAPAAALAVGNNAQQISQPASLAEKHQAIPSNVPAVRPKVVTSTPSISIQPTVDLARYEMETYTPKEVDPHDRDVLCGRGGLTNYHPGNAWYRNMVRANRSLYKASPKHSKILVAKSICGHVLAQGSRFLECDKRSGSWFTISYKRAVDKTSQALREKDRYSEEPEMEVNHIFSQPAGPFSIVTHPPPDSNTPPRFIEDLKKRKAVDGDISVKSHISRSVEVSAKAGNRIPRAKPLPKAGVSTAARMAAASGITCGTTTVNRSNIPVSDVNQTSKEGPTVAYRFAQEMQEMPTSSGDERVNQLASLFWQNTKRLKTNDIGERESSADPSSIYHDPLHNQNKLTHHDGVPTIATPVGDTPTKQISSHPQINNSSFLATDGTTNTVTRALVNKFFQTKRESKGIPGPAGQSENAANDQFADSQEDQFADPEDEDEHHSLGKPPDVIGNSATNSMAQNEEKDIEGKHFEMQKNEEIASSQERPNESVIDREAEAAAAMDMLAFAATTKDETERDPTHQSVPVHSSSDLIQPEININVSGGITTDDGEKTPPSCRICKSPLFSAQHLGVCPSAMIHPELIWIEPGGAISPETRLLADMVHDHCRRHHPHWPLWNVLTPMGIDTPTPINVFHRALAASAAALPHKIGDTYESVHELCYRVGHRLGLAKGWIWWSPWQDYGKKTSGNFQALCTASKPAATSLLVDYERRLIGAICENWATIQTISHQERVDIYNNFFTIPYCIESLRLKGNLFPTVHPVAQQVPS